MKHFYINTQSEQNGLDFSEKKAINNVHSFPTFTGTSYYSFYSTSTSLNDENNEITHQFKEQDYTINLDWLQFIVTPTVDNYSLDLYNADNLQLERKKTHHNPNFISCHKVVYDGEEVMEIYSRPINMTHKMSELSVKISNHLLYQSMCSDVIIHLLDILDLRFERLTKIAIALDGKSNSKILDYLNRYLRTKTIQINNDILQVTPYAFKKEELKWSGFTIGNKRSQKQARVYNKSDELKSNPKHFINLFWKLNGVNFSFDDIIRYEIELGFRHLKKYKVDSISDLLDVKFLTQIFKEETFDWLKFYKVSLRDAKTLRKDKAIKKGKELKYIKWNKLPVLTKTLEKIKHLPNEQVNAKKSITFSIEQIRKNDDHISTTTHVNYIKTIVNDFELQSYVLNKINEKFPNIIFEDNHPIKTLIEEYNFGEIGFVKYQKALHNSSLD